MRLIIALTFTFCLFVTSCREKKKKNDFKEYYLMDQVKISGIEPYQIKRKPRIPYTNNSIFDPFVKKNSIQGRAKSTFKFKKGGLANIKFLSKDTSLIDVANRNAYHEKIKLAYPIIVENLSETDTLYLKLFRGKMILNQEAKNKKDKWVSIEKNTVEKMGYYYYKIYPEQYIYTKTPRYKGDFITDLRVKIIINDSAIYTTKQFKGSIPKKMAK